ncbi:MAG: hypothetical protein M0Z95_13890 [Actinomycetota bacterium]|jgi:predicted transcriptional regulator|nr:hypothetical protein [Actinomycetota bacterium]
MSTTIRVSEQTRNRFAQLAKKTPWSMTKLLGQTADPLERQAFFDGCTARFNHWDVSCA